jgi:hypothetical protein
MNRIWTILSAVAVLVMALVAPGCDKPGRELSTYHVWDVDTLVVAPKGFPSTGLWVEDAMRQVAGYEDSVTLHVDFDVLDGRTLGFYVVDVPNMNLWSDSLPFVAVDSQAHLPATSSAHFTVPNVPNGAYYVIFDNRGDTTQGRTVVDVKCDLTFWKHVGGS